MGAQPLYDLSIQAQWTHAPDWTGRAEGARPPSRVPDGTSPQPWDVSDVCQARFGVRHLQSFVDSTLPAAGRPGTAATRRGAGGRVFAVNGRQMFVRGGNYTCSDMLLRQPPARVKHEVLLHAQARINMLRCWGGAACQPAAFYEACDEMGILVLHLSPVASRLSHSRALCLALAGFLMYMSGQVWVEFWITGDNDGRFPGAGSRDYPLDHPLFLQVPCLLVPACPLGLDAINECLAASCVVGGII